MCSYYVNTRKTFNMVNLFFFFGGQNHGGSYNAVNYKEIWEKKKWKPDNMMSYVDDGDNLVVYN